MVRLETERGFVKISESVITYVTGHAATNCFGVKGMAVRSLTDGFVHLLKREAMSRGVKVTTDDSDTVEIELHIVVEHGVNIQALCNSIIGEVRYHVARTTGVTVRSVDVYVDSIVCD